MHGTGSYPLRALAVAAVLATGCGTRVAGRLYGTGTTAVAPTTAPASTSTTIDAAAVKAEITSNWEQFFAHGQTLAQREALLENGSQYAAALASQAGNPLQAQASAVVHAVTLVAPDRATVTYDVLLNGKVALPAAAGAAVLQGGTWKVSDQSFCSLVTLTGKVPGCS